MKLITNYIAMKIKYLTYSERSRVYQTPSIQMFSFLVEQTVLNGSNLNPLESDAPEGYNVDKDDFNW